MAFKNNIKKIVPDSILYFLKRLVIKIIIRKKQVRCISMSQVGQDYWVYGEVFNEKRDGFFIDIGAHNGVNFSNTFLLEKRYNWTGICIEANPNLFQSLKSNRSCKCLNQCVSNKEESLTFALSGLWGGIVAPDCDLSRVESNNTITLEAVRLENLLQQEGAPSVIDYLSIDIEGAEDRVLLEFPFEKYIFNCITIERPSNKLKALLAEKGYILIKEIPGLDCFFIHRSFKDYYTSNIFKFGRKKFLRMPWRILVELSYE